MFGRVEEGERIAGGADLTIGMRGIDCLIEEGGRIAGGADLTMGMRGIESLSGEG